MDLDQSERDTFATEITDRLEEYNDILLDFEKAASDKDLLHKLFRVAHTIKGNAGFVGLSNMVRIGHVAENLLVLIRDGKIKLDNKLSDLLFKSGDLITNILDCFVTSKQDPLSIDVEPIAQQIETYINVHLASQESQENTQQETVDDIQEESPGTTDDSIESASKNIDGLEITIQIKSKAPLPGMRAYLIRSKLEKIATIHYESPSIAEYDNKGFNGLLTFKVSSESTQSQIESTIKNHEIESLEFKNIEIEQSLFGTAKTEITTYPSTPVSTSKKIISNESMDADEESDESLLFKTDTNKTIEPQANQAQTKGLASTMDALKVPVQKIDDILNLVGELLSANSAYLAIASDYRSNHGNRGIYVHLRDNSEELARISGELQEKVMRVRMIPVGTVFNRFRRLMRDYNANHPNKESILKISGEETEVDKKQIDSIYDPLMHLLRNSLDHGIESQEERKRQGKDPVGTIHLSSYQDGNSIFIEVSDDGKGLDLERIKNKALESRVVSQEELARYSNDEIINLIFLPGFSTAQKVTDVSGRGVGMDVVRRNIEEISGSVSVTTRPGEGSTFSIKIPLSMAIITALKIYVQDRLMAIPISSIIETTKVFEKDITIIEQLENIKVRDEYISLIRLDKEMGMATNNQVNGDQTSLPNQKTKDTKKPIVIVQYENTKMALMIDDVIGYEDMVIKSLSKNYEEIEGVAGAALLGRGEICLILDVHKLIDEIIQSAQSITETKTNLLRTFTTPQKSTPVIAAPVTQNPTAQKKSGLDADQLTIIKNLVSTGRKKAHEALTKLTGHDALRMKISTTRIQSLGRFKANLNKVCEQEQCHTFYVSMEGDVRGNQVVIINSQNILKLARMLYKDETLDSLSMEVISSIQEVTNILAVSYTNAITHLTGLEVLPSSPRHLPDYSRLFSDNLLYENDDTSTVLLIETEFLFESEKSLLFFYVLPDQKSFSKITSKST